MDESLKHRSQEIALFAAGCFWGIEELFQSLKGVIDTTVGYAGGVGENPTYVEVCSGKTGHAETVQVVFDPSQISYETLVHSFFNWHDPTTLNRQKNDIGTQYRSVIFYQNDHQRDVAHQIISRLSDLKKWKNPIVTELVPAPVFYPAEEEHQDYLKKHPDGYRCH